MKALNGSDDTTLVDFLVSLPSAGEVTEYVQLYLGDTARAAAFGKELIRIKRTSPQITGGLPGGGRIRGCRSRSGRRRRSEWRRRGWAGRARRVEPAAEEGGKGEGKEMIPSPY